jgi:catechol 2,3-dioxygenase-like lactoylglutathione lyase family enzyme
LIEIRGLCPLLQVFDMPLSVRFYCEVLGFEISSRSPTYAVENGVERFHWVLLRRGDTELMLNTAYDEGERPASPALERVASHGDTGLFFGCPDVDAAYELPQKQPGMECGSCHFVTQMVTELRFNGAWLETRFCSGVIQDRLRECADVI